MSASPADGDSPQGKAEATYNAAADYYDSPANTFWSRFGQRTIERLPLQPGNRVLDVCCGAGASAIPAARAVRPGGTVVGVDLSEKLLQLARKKAAAEEISNVDFRLGDMLDLREAEASFDAVVCVFGIFFVPDIPQAVRALWRLVRPGGMLAITTWGPQFLEPGSTAFWNSIRDVRPDLYRGFNPWDRICEPRTVLAALREAGVENAQAIAESGEHPIASPDAWWCAVLGSGYRGTLEQLTPADQERVRLANLDFIERNGIGSVAANVVYATAVRSRDGRGVVLE